MGHLLQQPFLQSYQHSGKDEYFDYGEASPIPFIAGKPMVEPCLEGMSSFLGSDNTGETTRWLVDETQVINPLAVRIILIRLF